MTERNVRNVPGSTESTPRLRVRRIAQDVTLAFLVVLVIFGFAAWESRAHAFAATHGLNNPVDETSSVRSIGTAPVVLARLSAMEPWQTTVPPSVLEAPTMRDIPDLLAIGVTTGPEGRHTMMPIPRQQIAEFAMEDQVFWHYAGRKSGQLPWFVAEQKKKHAVITGRSQFAMLAIVFAVMSALTMGLWRQFPGTSRTGHTRKRTVRRLR